MNDRVNIPDPPAEWSRGVDYREELKLARFSRASYLDEIAISNPDPDVNPDYEYLFAEKLGPDRWFQEAHINENDTTGFVAYAFVNDDQQRVVIAIRGSDNAPDWTGPNVAVARDGELLDMLNLPSPGTDRTRAQMAKVQETMLPGDAWDPQFRQALDFAKAVRDQYEPLGYKIEAVGHSMGGAQAQVLSHTFGWDGRSFDAPGAANIVQSQGYRQWLADNGTTPAQVPRFRSSQDAFDGTGFLNYQVNNSAVSKKAGPHLGESQSISSVTGREGFGSHARYAAGIVGGAINETPFLGQALKATGATRLATTIGYAAHGSHHGIDALDRHDTNRIVAVFEEAVRRQDRGDRQPLPIFGDQDKRDLPPIAQTEPRRVFEGTPLERQQQATRSLLDGPNDGPLARFLDATMSGDTEAFRKAARDLCATPEAKAWLQAGQERLQALQQQVAPTNEPVKETQEQAVQQHARILPAEQGLMR